MKHFATILLQVILITCIFGFLFWNAIAAVDDEGKNIFTILYEQPKQWHFLAGAFVAQFLALSLTIIRWYCLLQALGLQCSRREAFRLGFFGYTLGLAPLGLVGGDAVRAVMIAQRNPDCRSQAVASVFVDRLVGLLVLFIYATIFVLYAGYFARPEIAAQTFTYAAFALTASALLGTAIVFLPFFAKGHAERLIAKVPLVGKLGSKFVHALLLFRNHKRCLLKCCCITVFSHLCFALSLYCAAIALFTSVPGVIDHVMLHSIANLAALIPLAAGPYEWALEELYQLSGICVGLGFIAALMYRMIAIAVAGATIAWYFASARQLVTD